MRVGHLLSQLLAVPAGSQEGAAKRAPLFADQPLSLLPARLPQQLGMVKLQLRLASR